MGGGGERFDCHGRALVPVGTGSLALDQAPSHANRGANGAPERVTAKTLRDYWREKPVSSSILLSPASLLAPPGLRG